MRVKSKGKNRVIVQISTFFITNLHLKGFADGTIYTGSLKNICVPGLNCYSCPGALGACPIGALQAVIGGARYKVSYYVCGMLILFGTLFGRFICGWLCPFGLVQDLLYRIKARKKELPRRIDKPLRYMKYGVLAIAVVLLPLTLTNQFGVAPPYYCKYLCPSGTLLGGIPLMITNPDLRQLAGFLFNWKMLILVLVLIGSIIIARPFCKYLCPLGAFYSLFNRISLIRQYVDLERCTNCKKCEGVCPMGIKPQQTPNNRECIRCGSCTGVCPHGAMSQGIRHRLGSVADKTTGNTENNEAGDGSHRRLTLMKRL